MKIFIIQSTFSDEKIAQNLANMIVEKKLGACVQLENITSIYKWQDKICNEIEYKLSIKTNKKKLKELKKLILEYHTYEVPEILISRAKSLHKPYSKWFKQSLI